MNAETKNIHFGFLALLCLLGLTVFLSYAPLGAWKEVVAYAFASLKALIILLVFMKFMKSGEVSLTYFALGFLALLILVIFVMDDLVFRTI